jgi:DNA primase
MAADAVAEIKARLDLVEVVAQYVRLQRSGRQFVGLCPFHAERTPSFSVSAERQAWYCFGCQEGGDIFSFVKKVERLDFRQALEQLAGRAGVELERDQGRGRQAAARRRQALDLHARAQAFYEHVLWDTAAGDPGRTLLVERGISEELARRFGIGFAPSGGTGGDALVRYLVARGWGTPADIAACGLAREANGGRREQDRFRHRLTFPIRDERSTVIGFGGRAVGDARPKYLNSPGTAIYDKSTALFGIDLARPAIVAAGVAVVVEGYFDVIAAHAADVTNTVASSGTALTRQQVRALGRLASVVVLSFDADDAGLSASSNAVDVVAGEGLSARICILPAQYKDPDELVRRDPAAFAACVAAAEPEWQVLVDRAVGDAEGGSVEERRHAVERAIAVLARIPETATRTLYVQRAARRLDLAPAALEADVERARATPRSAPRVVAALPPPPAGQPGGEGLPDGAEGNPLPSWETYLGRVVVQQPGVARTLISEHALRGEEFSQPLLGHILQVAAGLPEGAPFPLESLSTAERALTMRHLYRPVPEMDDPDDVERLDRAIAQCVQRTRVAGIDRELAEVRREKRRAADDGRAADVERLAERLAKLSNERQRLREGLAGAVSMAPTR